MRIIRIATIESEGYKQYLKQWLSKTAQTPELKNPLYLRRDRITQKDAKQCPECSTWNNIGPSGLPVREVYDFYNKGDDPRYFEDEENRCQHCLYRLGPSHIPNPRRPSPFPQDMYDFPSQRPKGPTFTSPKEREPKRMPDLVEQMEGNRRWDYYNPNKLSAGNDGWNITVLAQDKPPRSKGDEMAEREYQKYLDEDMKTNISLAIMKIVAEGEKELNSGYKYISSSIQTIKIDTPIPKNPDDPFTIIITVIFRRPKRDVYHYKENTISIVKAKKNKMINEIKTITGTTPTIEFMIIDSFADTKDAIRQYHIRLQKERQLQREHRLLGITASHKAQYIGDCINSFDPNGNCTNNLFQDATQFSQREEDARDQDDNLKEGTRINEEAFKNLAEVPDSLLGRDIEFYRLPRDTDNITYNTDILVAYDQDSGTHHFFA